jgi:hypothetical protein
MMVGQGAENADMSRRMIVPFAFFTLSLAAQGGLLGDVLADEAPPPGAGRAIP